MEGKLFLGQFLVWVILLLGQVHGYKSCIEKERRALLELKKYLIPSNESYSGITTWTNDTESDCCQWEGVMCNRTSGRIIKLFIGRSTYGESSLDLSLLHPFEEVQSIDLSMSGFIGLFDDVEGYKSLRRLRNLEALDLSANVFNNSIFPFLNAATSLKTLFLGNNDMDGLIPVRELKDLTNLELLDLSENRFNGSIPVRDLLPLRKLKALNLRHNEFSASMELQGICQLKNVEELDLSQNKFVGQFPLCLTSLTRLRVLDLSSNQFTGKLPSTVRNLELLQFLSLFDNNFEGSFSLGSLANLSELKVFRLNAKSNSLQIEFESFWKPKFQLNVIALPSCNLEKVPHFLLHQKDLRYVDLSNNKISGAFPSWLLENNTKLEVLFLQNNSLTNFHLPKSSHHHLVFLNLSANEFSHFLPENIGWILPGLRYMNLANNGFGGNLPSSLCNMNSIEYLDLSNNSFNGKLPRSFVNGCYSMRTLKLSHNKLSGEIFQKSAKITNITALFMDNNQFTGKIGQGLRSLTSLYMLDISNNNLTGVIPSWIGELTFFSLLLSNNSLEGEIPVSLSNQTSLRLLDLSANILSGKIPPQLNSTRPVMLLLQDNNFSGDIPGSLLGNVKVLDLRNNRLSGNIPEFTNTQSISILLLRGNHLTGSIPKQLCGLRNIHLLDLANNRLNGSIPSSLSNTSFGLAKEDMQFSYDFGINVHTFSRFSNLETDSISTENVGTYFKSLVVLDQFELEYNVGTQTTIEFATKHRYDAYIGGNLGYLFGLDLSENELSGEIPVELGGLLKLHVFNLSHNNISGVIPESFSGMKNMESLDLSYNSLQGRIPPQLTSLSSLAVFNVSYNNVSGVIPQGRQFNTFDKESYIGNPLLCGTPINRSCNNNTFLESDDEVEVDESIIDMVSFYWSFAATYVTILLGILALLSFVSPWSRASFYIVDAFIYKVKNLLW